MEGVAELHMTRCKENPLMLALVKDKTLPAYLYSTGSVISNAPIYLRSVRVLLYAYAHIARLGVLKECCAYKWCVADDAIHAAKKQGCDIDL